MSYIIWNASFESDIVGKGDNFLINDGNAACGQNGW